MSRTSRGCVTLWCRLLVTVWPLHLVVLVFEECLRLRGGVLLFGVGCWLLCDHYIWSYCFWLCLLFMHSVLLAAMVSWLLTGLLVIQKKIFPFSYFMVISLPMFCTCSCVVSWVVQNETAKTWWTGAPGKPLQVYCLFSVALTWERVWRPWALDGGSGTITCPVALFLQWYHVQNVISFFHLHILSVGRDTELYSGVSLNYECGRWVWPCSGSSRHWVWSERCLAKAIIERIASRRRNVRLNAARF